MIILNDIMLMVNDDLVLLFATQFLPIENANMSCKDVVINL